MKKICFITGLAMILLFSGCSGTDQSQQRDENNRHYMNVRNTTVKGVSRDESETVSKHLANLAANVPGVNGSSAVALGKYAIVAIDVDKDFDRSKVGSIKYTVAEALKKDPYGKNAVVVADPDIFARLNEVREDIRNGRPVQGILNELSDIVGRIMPEVPGDLQDPEVEERMDESKREINEEEAEMLDKQQNNQSKKHYKGSRQ